MPAQTVFTLYCAYFNVRYTQNTRKNKQNLQNMQNVY